MIAGIGTDLASVARMRALHARYGARLAQRLLHPEELPALAAASDAGAFLAKRFAAKEALAKALGTGIRGAVSFNAMAICHDALGRPGFRFSGALADHVAGRGLRFHLSLSDEKEHALAFVVAEFDPPRPECPTS